MPARSHPRVDDAKQGRATDSVADSARRARVDLRLLAAGLLSNELLGALQTQASTTGSWFTTSAPGNMDQYVRFFLYEPEAKTAKNRMHFDLRAPKTVEAEAARLVALGAVVHTVHEGLTVMTDPEGNEFCVE